MENSGPLVDRDQSGDLAFRQGVEGGFRVALFQVIHLSLGVGHAIEITSGTTIHEYAQECATATDALDRVGTRGWRSSKARRMMRE